MLIEDFLAHLQVERRLSANTLDAYRRDLDALADWARQQAIADPGSSPGQALPMLQTEQLRAFIAAEHRRGLSPKSLQRRLSACRSFYQWLLRHGRIKANPAAGIRAPKAPRKALAKKAARVAKGPARPYKKVEADALKLRVDTMKKKIGLLESKAVILRDRLEMHELEVKYRSEEGAPKAV